MCGIFGYQGNAPDERLFTLAVHGASRRGPHGCGWHIQDSHKRHTERHLADLADKTPHIIAKSYDLVHGTIIGHARMATVGAWNKISNLQPILAGSHVIAHNGVIYNPDTLHADAATDTYAFAYAYEELRARCTPEDAIAKLLAEADQTAWALAVLDANGILYVNRRYHPLYLYEPYGRGRYLSSARIHPDAVLLAEDVVHTFDPDVY